MKRKDISSVLFFPPPILQILTDSITFERIISDFYRYKGHVPNTKEVISFFIHNEVFRFQVCFRLLKAKKCLIPRRILAKLKEKIARRRHIELPNEVSVGFGLYLGHAIDIVINPTTIIGNNCNLSQFLNIGSNLGCAAVIGNNVYIGPQVCLVEKVLIGDNCVIGAGAIVTSNIPSNSTAVGCPAKIVNSTPKNFIKNPWSFDIMI